MRYVLIALWVAGSAAASLGEDVRVFIAPQTTLIPASGKVTFDVYWTNSGSSARRISPRGVYEFSFSSLATEYTSIGNHAALDYHTSPERRIMPRAIIRDRVVIPIGVHKHVRLIEVSARFARRGWSPDFTSNTVVLRNPSS